MDIYKINTIEELIKGNSYVLSQVRARTAKRLLLHTL